MGPEGALLPLQNPRPWTLPTVKLMPIPLTTTVTFNVTQPVGHNTNQLHDSTSY